MVPASSAPLSPAAPERDESSDDGRATQLLAILQRDGRLVDFLMEDLTSYADAQIGAAVRNIHADCRQSLQRYFALVPLHDGEENSVVTINAGTDASTVKLTGNVAGSPPYRGVLRHRGWKVSRFDLPPIPQSGRSVVAPAEVEVS